MFYPIKRYAPLKTTASALRSRPAYVPIKPKLGFRKTDLAHRSKPSPRATGDLLMDNHALSDPSRFTVAQICWAKTTVRELEARAIHHWTILLSRCRDRFGYEYPEVVKRAESSPSRDLADEPAIRQLACEATWRDAGREQGAPLASHCGRLRSNIESLRLRLGWIHMLEELIKSPIDADDTNMELY